MSFVPLRRCCCICQGQNKAASPPLSNLLFMPERKDVAGFLTLIHTWWTVVNSGKRFHPNQLGNAIIKEDRKTEFMRELALWFKSWSNTPKFCLSKQICNALIRTLRAQACLIIEDLLNLCAQGNSRVIHWREDLDSIVR